MKRWSLPFLITAAVAACSDSHASPNASPNASSTTSAASSAAAAPARQCIVGIDLSASRSKTQLADGEALLRSVVNNLKPGDRLVLIQTYQAARDDASRWSTELPPLQEPGRPTGGERRKIEQARNTALAIVPTFFDSAKSKSIQTTDILQTLFIAGDYARARPRDSTIVLVLSDMLNSTPELNMERAGGIPDSAWIAARARDGRMPKVGGVCIVAVGADVSSKRGAEVRRFWERYFGVAGAVMPHANYRTMVSDAGEVGCG